MRRSIAVHFLTVVGDAHHTVAFVTVCKTVDKTVLLSANTRRDNPAAAERRDVAIEIVIISRVVDTSPTVIVGILRRYNSREGVVAQPVAVPWLTGAIRTPVHPADITSGCKVKPLAITAGTHCHSPRTDVVCVLVDQCFARTVSRGFLGYTPQGIVASTA